MITFGWSEEGVRQMTSAPASRLRLWNRGLIRLGMAAGPGSRFLSIDGGHLAADAQRQYNEASWRS